MQEFMSNAAAALAHMQSQLLQLSSAHQGSSLQNPNGPGQSWSSHRGGLASRVDGNLPGAHLLPGSQGQLHLSHTSLLQLHESRKSFPCMLNGARFVICVGRRN